MKIFESLSDAWDALAEQAPTNKVYDRCKDKARKLLKVRGRAIILGWGYLLRPVLLTDLAAWVRLSYKVGSHPLTYLREATGVKCICVEDWRLSSPANENEYKIVVGRWGLELYEGAECIASIIEKKEGEGEE